MKGLELGAHTVTGEGLAKCVHMCEMVCVVALPLKYKMSSEHHYIKVKPKELSYKFQMVQNHTKSKYKIFIEMQQYKPL